MPENQKERTHRLKKKNLRESRLRKKNKLKLIKIHGGKCVICGYDRYDKALEFHHIDKSNKKDRISNITRHFLAAVEESKKCILVCSNCHREIEGGITEIPEKFLRPLAQ